MHADITRATRARQRGDGRSSTEVEVARSPTEFFCSPHTNLDSDAAAYQESHSGTWYRDQVLGIFSESPPSEGCPSVR